MRSLLLVSLLLAACAHEDEPAATVADAQPLLSSTADLEHDGVVRVQSAGRLCTGTMVSASAVLTAAHCLDGAAAEDAMVRLDDIDAANDSSSASGAEPDGDADHGADSDDGFAPLRGVAFQLHPDWNPDTFAADVAVLFLAGAAGDPTAPLHASGVMALAVDAPSSGEEVLLVGYGVDEHGAHNVRRAGTARVAGIGAAELGLQPAPSAPCHGDSGGPVLVREDGEERIAAVVSHGPAGCDGETTAARADGAAGAFVHGALAAHDAERPHRAQDPEDSGDGAVVGVIACSFVGARAGGRSPDTASTPLAFALLLAALVSFAARIRRQ